MYRYNVSYWSSLEKWEELYIPIQCKLLVSRREMGGVICNDTM